MTDRRGLLLIISSPSGAGKSTLTQRLIDWDPSIRFSISATTRPPRDGEVDGEHYHFRDRDGFMDMVKSGQMLEWAEVFGNLYGSPLGPVATNLEAGTDTVFDIDWQGGQQIRDSALGADVVSIFVLPPSISELENRLRSRGKDSDSVISDRMAKSQIEISHWAEYDYVLVNDNIDRAEEECRAIVTAERLKRTRQTGLVEFVRGLDKEFKERK